MATPLTEIELIRDKTRVTTTQFSDAKIESYRLEYLHLTRVERVYRISADIYDNLAAQYAGGTVQIGEQSLSGLDLREKANDFRARAIMGRLFIQ